jgi:hypothetical protein
MSLRPVTASAAEKPIFPVKKNKIVTGMSGSLTIFQSKEYVSITPRSWCSESESSFSCFSKATKVVATRNTTPQNPKKPDRVTRP